MSYVRFPPKVVIVFSGKEAGFDSKNNHRYGKSPNFWLHIISKIKCKILPVISYISSELGLKKVQPVQRFYK